MNIGLDPSVRFILVIACVFAFTGLRVKLSEQKLWMAVDTSKL